MYSVAEVREKDALKVTYIFPIHRVSGSKTASRTTMSALSGSLTTNSTRESRKTRL